MDKVRLMNIIVGICFAMISVTHGVVIAADEIVLDDGRIAEHAAEKTESVTETAIKVEEVKEEAKQEKTTDVEEAEPEIAREDTEIVPPASTIPQKTLSKGEKLYQIKACNACHGNDAKTSSQPLYPKLAGQSKEYIIAQIKDFYNGKRDNGSSVVMKGGMSTITNQKGVEIEEVEILAEWLESLVIGWTNNNLANTARGAMLYQTKNCYTCHGKNAYSPILPIYPKLAGQQKEYTIAQMKDIKSGKRSNGHSAAMKGVMHDVTDNEIEAIAKWLESFEPNKDEPQIN